jgi:hypothetical protein
MKNREGLRILLKQIVSRASGMGNNNTNHFSVTTGPTDFSVEITVCYNSDIRSWGSSVSIVTELRARRPGVRFLA